MSKHRNIYYNLDNNNSKQPCTLVNQSRNGWYYKEERKEQYKENLSKQLLSYNRNMEHVIDAQDVWKRIVKACNQSFPKKGRNTKHTPVY